MIDDGTGAVDRGEALLLLMVVDQGDALAEGRRLQRLERQQKR